MKTERERLEYLVEACRRRNLPARQAKFQAELDMLKIKEEKQAKKKKNTV